MNPYERRFIACDATDPRAAANARLYDPEVIHRQAMAAIVARIEATHALRQALKRRSAAAAKAAILRRQSAALTAKADRIEGTTA